MSTLTAQLTFVPMRRKHVRDVVEIEQKVYPQPWSSNLFLSEIAMPATRDYTVAIQADQIVGYAGMAYVEHESHITTIAVDPMFQGQSIATRLMLHNVALCAERGVQSMTLEVRVSNAPAQALYRRFGFVPAGVRPKYYSNPVEDALIMWAYDIDTEEFAERIRQVGDKVSS